jgi:hypothetical protein
LTRVLKIRNDLPVVPVCRSVCLRLFLRGKANQQVSACADGSREQALDDKKHPA